MSESSVDQLIKNYLDNFDTINNDTNREYYKWEAFKQFKDNFDIDAADFPAMLKKAFSKTSNLINNRVVQSLNGILKLAENKELTETIRDMFKTLYLTDDNGDIDKRQERIDNFVSEFNSLLLKYEPEKWKYKQSFRTALYYLNLYAPDKNYLYKATQAKEFMYCAELGDDLGSGQSFKLRNYYRLCDWLVERIKSTPELIKRHKDRMTSDMIDNDDYHILTYDIIYCAVAYKLYNGIDYRPLRPTGKEHAARIKAENTMKAISEQREKLDDLIIERSEYDSFSATGLKVFHKSFGEGIITSQDGFYIYAKFADGEKKYMIPDSFTNGFLKTEDDEIVTTISEMSRLDKEIEAVRQDISDLNRKLK